MPAELRITNAANLEQGDRSVIQNVNIMRFSALLSAYLHHHFEAIVSQDAGSELTPAVRLALVPCIRSEQSDSGCFT